MEAVTGALGATGVAALVLTGAGAALAFTTGLEEALAEVLAGALTGAFATVLVTALAGAFTTALVGVLALASLLTGAAGLACTPFLAGAALADVVFTGAATFFFGVVTSCLLAV
ncbi:hypothetical protein [Limnohabitans sp. 15K]|uniref:hypothetical protein n=1 Tax=Limnohabitans sp. 15K TaxID=1100706 RepID=UPI00117BDCC7|nr:hypothetical protein [Limnohabitans sp. 15K]